MKMYENIKDERLFVFRKKIIDHLAHDDFPRRVMCAHCKTSRRSYLFYRTFSDVALFPVLHPSHHVSACTEGIQVLSVHDVLDTGSIHYIRWKNRVLNDQAVSFSIKSQVYGRDSIFISPKKSPLVSR
jgi:hypothetical protein